MLTPTWDTLFWFAIFGFGVLGFVLRHSKIVPLMIGMYISLAVTNEIGLELYRFLLKSEVGGVEASLFAVRIVIFVVLTFLLFIEGDAISPATESAGMMGSIKGGIWGLVAGMIFVSTLVDFMGAADQKSMLVKSSIAATLDPWRVWLLLPFPVVLAVSSLLKRFR